MFHEQWTRALIVVCALNIIAFLCLYQCYGTSDHVFVAGVQMYINTYFLMYPSIPVHRVVLTKHTFSSPFVAKFYTTIGRFILMYQFMEYYHVLQGTIFPIKFVLYLVVLAEVASWLGCVQMNWDFLLIETMLHALIAFVLGLLLVVMWPSMQFVQFLTLFIIDVACCTFYFWVEIPFCLEEMHISSVLPPPANLVGLRSFVFEKFEDRSWHFWGNNYLVYTNKIIVVITLSLYLCYLHEQVLS